MQKSARRGETPLDAALSIREPAGQPTRAVVLVLPGGKPDSLAPTSRAAPPALRMRPFARGLHRAGRRIGLAAWTLHYRYQGWNGEQAMLLRYRTWQRLAITFTVSSVLNRK